MKLPRNYDTVSEAVNDLQEIGYTTNFSLLAEKGCLVCNQTSVQLSPEEFQIDEIYRFEGDSDPGDEMIVMAVSSPTREMKGVVVNAFGIYSDSEISKITALIKKHRSQGYEYN